MKLSALLAPLIAVKADHATIMDVVLAFEAEQTDGLAKRRENDAKRQAEKRKRDESHVTSRDVTVTVSSHASASPAPDLENKQTNKQENKIDASPSAQPKRGTRLPEDFTPDLNWAVAQGLSFSEAQTEAAQFLDYWRSKAGKDALKADWPATWRTWVRNSIKRTTGPPRKRNFVDAAMDRINGINGHGSESVFGNNGDAQRLSAGRSEPRSDVADVRSGLSRQFVRGGH